MSGELEEEPFIPEYMHLANLLHISAPELLNRLITEPSLLHVVSYSKCREGEEKNFVISPFLVNIILLSMHLGAKGDTLNQIQVAMGHTNIDRKNLKRTAKALLHVLKDEDIYVFASAQKICVTSAKDLKKNFKIVAEGVFYIDVESLDFRDAEKAEEKINTWIRSETPGVVHWMVPPRLLTADCNMVVVNTVYFEADWKVRFKELHTSRQGFSVRPDYDVEVEFMHSLAYYQYYETPEVNARFLKLALKEDNSFLIIVLPNEKFGLADIESKMDAVISVPDEQFRFQHVKGAVPKYIISTIIDWRETLMELGVRRLFTEHEAQLQEIAGDPGALHLNHLIQRVIIRINEKGVDSDPTYCSQKNIPRPCLPSSQAREFIADHPFLFYIKLRNVIVFIGRLTNPTRTEEVV